jgi:hypothetical protein
MQGMERAVLLVQQSEMLHDRVEELKGLMETAVEQMRSRVHEADIQHAVAAESLMVQSVLQTKNH